MDLPVPSSRKEIALLFCSFSGHGNTPNHYDLFRYLQADGSSSFSWNSRLGGVLESPAECEERENLLLALAHQATADRAACTDAETLEQDLAVEKIMEKERSALRTPKNSRRAPKDPPPPPAKKAKRLRTSASPILAPKPAQAGRHISFANPDSSNPPAPSSPTKIRAQPRTWKELPRACRRLFVAAISPYFESYLEWSSAGDADKCAGVLEKILDFPAQAMRKGAVRALQQSLSDFQSQFTELTKPGGLLIRPLRTSEPDIPPNSVAIPIAPAPIVEEDVDSDAITEPEDDPASVEAMAATVKRAVATVREGGPRCLSRAANQLMQQPPAPITAETVLQLRSLHPAATESMPPLPKERAPEMVAIDAGLLHKILKSRVDNGSAPGPSGWTGSHLRLIAECDNKAARDGLAALVQDLCNGRFEGALKSRLLSCTLMPIWKAGGASAKGIRPIAIGEVFVKLAAHYSMAMIEDQLPSLFPRIQYGVKRPGGSETAAQLTRALFEQSRREDPTTVALKTDFMNAFNATSRAQAWRTLLAHSSTEPMWRMFHWAYSSKSPLLVFDKGRLHTELSSSEGMRQGDPFAAFVFALCVQSLYEKILEGLPGCKAVSVLDDLTLIGPLAQVLQAYDRIKQHAPEYHLQLRTEKCQVFIPPQLDDRAILDSIHSACLERSLAHQTRIEALGVVFGEDADVKEHAAAAVASHERFFALLTHPSMPVQVGYSLLRYCAIPRLSFLSRTVHPRLFASATVRFDAMVRECFGKMMHIEADSKILLAPSLTAEQIDERIALPINMGGLGMRPFSRISHAAYFSSLVTILPDFHVAFPSCADLTATAVHAELSECRAAILPRIDVGSAERSLRSIHEDAAKLGGRNRIRGPYKRKGLFTALSRAQSFRNPNPKSSPKQQHHQPIQFAKFSNATSPTSGRRRNPARPRRRSHTRSLESFGCSIRSQGCRSSNSTSHIFSPRHATSRRSSRRWRSRRMRAHGSPFCRARSPIAWTTPPFASPCAIDSVFSPLIRWPREAVMQKPARQHLLIWRIPITCIPARCIVTHSRRSVTTTSCRR